MLKRGANPSYPSALLSLGSIEDHPTNALQVDFANKYIGGGALHRGCVQSNIIMYFNLFLLIGRQIRLFVGLLINLNLVNMKDFFQTCWTSFSSFYTVSCQFLKQKDSPGIVTGDWGCGAFWGDPKLKAIIQWLAASQVIILYKNIVKARYIYK
ncbi:hypothetical protein Patl1_27044 [Pistacia atlantica]|uniref:Uncharacterized protein n=1 Tax=Pistacia atlantica TaxID=434234 RepID=A0ACC1B3D0_9ROSI|nr:hypothetical protein Patl1_27044 [Pistacia atlantica]